MNLVFSMSQKLLEKDRNRLDYPKLQFNVPVKNFRFFLKSEFIIFVIIAGGQKAKVSGLISIPNIQDDPVNHICQISLKFGVMTIGKWWFMYRQKKKPVTNTPGLKMRWPAPSLGRLDASHWLYSVGLFKHSSGKWKSLIHSHIKPFRNILRFLWIL